MATYGYARVSTKDQDLTTQTEMLTAAGAAIVYGEKASGTKRAGRAKLDIVMELMERGDTLVVTRIDRLARSLRDLQNIVYELRQRGIALKATEQPIDTSTPAGKCFLDMLGVFAEFETSIRSERQREGIERAKAVGSIYKGRKRSIDRVRVMRLRDEGMGPAQIALTMRIDRTSVYRILQEAGAAA